jgi:hypothetical protein
MPQGSKQVFPYDGVRISCLLPNSKDALLDDILQKTKAANNIDENVEYMAWNHETGGVIENTIVGSCKIFCNILDYTLLLRSA